MPMKVRSRLALSLAVVSTFQQTPATAQATSITPVEGTYADVAALAERAGLVARVEVTMMAPVEPARVTGVRPGHRRFYIEAKTRALLTGSAPLGARVEYLVDFPLDALGEPPDLKHRNVFIFARRVPQKPEQLQLVTPTAQLPWSPAGAARLRQILWAMVSNDAPPKITGVRELIYVPGPLAGQGRTQVFLGTQDGSAASITVRHVPGHPTTWGASFSEIAAQVDRPPERGTLEWYRLACFLPSDPPANANRSKTGQERWQALADYRLVMKDLGPCHRRLT